MIFCRNRSLIYMLQTVKAAHVWITFYLHVSLLLICCQVSSLFWSRRVALWIGRQLFKQRTKVQALLLASIRLTEAAVSKKKKKKKRRISASLYLSFSSDLPARGQAEYRHNDQWKIRLLFNFCYWKSRFVTLSLCFLFFFLNPCGIFIMSPEQNFDLSSSEHFTV